MIAPFTSIEHELKSLIEGECFFDRDTREQYSTAASWYKIQPIGVVFPKHIADVQAVARFCNENGIPIIPRGAGTGLAGQAVGMGIVLDFTRHLNGMIRRHDDVVVVQPGIVLKTLNDRLAGTGKFFPVDPASGSLCTIGGMISTNAAGARGLKYGATKDHIEHLSLVLANGEALTLNDAFKPSPLRTRLEQQIAELLLPQKELIDSRFPDVAKNSSGYNLKETILHDGKQNGNRQIDLRKLIVGSEGTLAIVIGAGLKLAPVPAHRTGALAYFSEYESTVEATVAVRSLDPAAIEILDQTYFSHGRGLGPMADTLLKQDALTMLYFEFEGANQEELEHAIERLKQRLLAFHPLDILVLKSEPERDAFWALREEISKRINFSDTFGKASFIEDITVPLQNLPSYFRGLRSILSQYGIRYSAYGHAGSGNIHCAAFVDLNNPEHYRAIDLIAADVNELAISLGGTLSGEHGDGFVRTPFLEQLYGAKIYGLFEEVKRIFDPSGILNPGKIIGKQHSTILHDLALA
ncbi:MAG: FAD-binding oxidoreductase [Ignavibacteriae bacterium]|nr:FAD-binding oxidoreductase [Ignavibacteriota bacterium]